MCVKSKEEAVELGAKTEHRDSLGVIETDFGGCIVEADKRLQQAKERDDGR